MKFLFFGDFYSLDVPSITFREDEIFFVKDAVYTHHIILFVIRCLNKRDLAHAIHQNLFRTHTKAATGEHLTIKLKPLEEFSRGDK